MLSKTIILIAAGSLAARRQAPMRHFASFWTTAWPTRHSLPRTMRRMAELLRKSTWHSTAVRRQWSRGGNFGLLGPKWHFFVLGKV